MKKWYKGLFLFALVLCILLAIPVGAETTVVASGTSGTLKWSLDDNGCLTITGTGAMSNFTSGKAPWSTYADDIYSVVIGDGITSVGNYAFYDCAMMKSVDLPEGLTKFGRYSFYSCERLESVALPSTVTTLDEYAFAYCYNLESVTFPDGLKTLGADAFTMCGSLEEIILPDSVTSIGTSCFAQCDDLERVVLSDGMTSIGSSAFFGCDELVEIVFPANLTTIEDTAINSCTSLVTITLPASLTSLGINPLSSNTSLQNIYVEEGNTAFKSVDGVLFSADGKELYAYPAGRSGAYEIPEGTETVIHGAFFTATGLTGITFPDSLKTIEDSAFAECYGLTEVDFNQVQTLEDQAFQGCKALTKVTFGENVTSIGAQLFYRAVNLAIVVEEIYFTGNAPTFVEDMYDYFPFRGVTATAYYPADNSTWTSSKRQNYNGTITWVAYDPDATTGSGTLDNDMTWVLDEDGKLTISGTGDMPDFETQPWDLLQDHIKSVELSDGITSVGAYSFYECENLASVSIPASVTVIGEGAFAECASLAEIALPEALKSIGTYAFYKSGITKIEIPDTCLTLGADAFYLCGQLGSVVLPAGLTEVPAECFAECDSLTRVTIPNSVTTLGGSAFFGCDALTEITLPDSLANYGDAALVYCQNLQIIYISEDNTSFTSVDGVLFSKDKTVLHCYPAGRSGEYVIPEGTVSVAFAGFAGGKLTGIQFPDSLTALGLNAFWDCDALTEVELGGGLTSTGGYSFYDCDGLTKVVIGGNITTIDGYTFYGCESLTDVEMGESVTTIGNRAFRYCSALETVVFGENVTSMGTYVFANCYDLTDIVMNEKLTVIGEGAFYQCTSLKEVEISDSVTTIGASAFSGCNKLVKVVIGKSVSSVGKRVFAFSNHDRTIKQIYFTGDAPTFNSDAFQYIYADVYYPADNTTWTSSVIGSSYGAFSGGIVWQAHTHSYNAVVTAPTCTEQGYTTYTCECTDSYVDNYVEVTGHSYVNGVCEHCGALQGEITRNYWTMSLDSVIYMNYYLNLEGFAEDVDFATQGGVIVWTGAEYPTSRDQVQIGLENCQVIPGMFLNESGDWYVRSNEIYAKNLGDWVYLRAYVEIAEGVYVYGPVGYYSPAQYCADMLKNENEAYETRRVCAALLEYGAAAQVYFNYKTDSLATDMAKDLAEADGIDIDLAQYNLEYNGDYLDKVVVDDHIEALSGTLTGTRKGITYKKSTLDLAGAVRISAGFDIDSSVIDWNDVAKAEVLFWSAEDIADLESLAYDLHNYTYSSELTPATGEETVDLGDYLCQSYHILAKNLGESVYYSCRIEMEDGTVYRGGLVYYSPEAFANDHINGDSTGQVVTVCQRIAVYSEMARLRFAENKE